MTRATAPLSHRQARDVCDLVLDVGGDPSRRQLERLCLHVRRLHAEQPDGDEVQRLVMRSRRAVHDLINALQPYAVRDSTPSAGVCLSPTGRRLFEAIAYRQADGVSTMSLRDLVGCKLSTVYHHINVMTALGFLQKDRAKVRRDGQHGGSLPYTFRLSTTGLAWAEQENVEVQKRSANTGGFGGYAIAGQCGGGA